MKCVKVHIYDDFDDILIVAALHTTKNTHQLNQTYLFILMQLLQSPNVNLVSDKSKTKGMCPIYQFDSHGRLSLSCGLLIYLTCFKRNSLSTIFSIIESILSWLYHIFVVVVTTSMTAPTVYNRRKRAKYVHATTTKRDKSRNQREQSLREREDDKRGF